MQDEPKDIEPIDYFGFIDAFLAMSKRARADNAARKKREEQAQLRLMHEQAAAAARSRLRGSVGSTSDEPELDDLISALKAGEFATAADPTTSRGPANRRTRTRGAREQAQKSTTASKLGDSASHA